MIVEVTYKIPHTFGMRADYEQSLDELATAEHAEWLGAGSGDYVRDTSYQVPDHRSGAFCQAVRAALPEATVRTHRERSE